MVDKIAKMWYNKKLGGNFRIAPVFDYKNREHI